MTIIEGTGKSIYDFRRFLTREYESGGIFPISSADLSLETDIRSSDLVMFSERYTDRRIVYLACIFSLPTLDPRDGPLEITVINALKPSLILPDLLTDLLKNPLIRGDSLGMISSHYFKPSSGITKRVLVEGSVSNSPFIKRVYDFLRSD